MTGSRRDRRKMRTVRYWIGLGWLAVICAVGAILAIGYLAPKSDVGPPPVVVRNHTTTTTFRAP